MTDSMFITDKYYNKHDLMYALAIYVVVTSLSVNGGVILL